MVTLLPLIHSAALLSLLWVESYYVDGRTWIPHSVLNVRRECPWGSPSARRPLLVRDRRNNKIGEALIFEPLWSNFHLIGARGGHSTHREEQLHNDDDNDTSSASTTTTNSSFTTTTITTSISKSPNLIQDGGTIQRPTQVEETVNGTLAEVKTAKHLSSNDTTPTLSPKATAKQVAKEQRKKEKEAKKRHKQIAKQLRNRNAVNKRRKFMHAAWGLLFASLNHFIPTRIFVPSMAIVTTGTLILELLRYREGFEWMNEAMHKILGHALRKNEMDGRFTGSFYYFLGVTVTAALYPKSCATLGICQLAIADPTASYFGRATRHVYWSRIGNGLGGLGRNKGILGFLGGAVACIPLNYRLLSLAKFQDPTTVSSKTIFMASMALGLAGAFADLIVPTPALTLPKKVCGVSVPPFHVDDNCIVPILSGLACQQIFRQYNWPTDLELATHLFAR